MAACTTTPCSSVTVYHPGEKNEKLLVYATRVNPARDRAPTLTNHCRVSRRASLQRTLNEHIAAARAPALCGNTALSATRTTTMVVPNDAIDVDELDDAGSALHHDSITSMLAAGTLPGAQPFKIPARPRSKPVQTAHPHFHEHTQNTPRSQSPDPPSADLEVVDIDDGAAQEYLEEVDQKELSPDDAPEEDHREQEYLEDHEQSPTDDQELNDQPKHTDYPTYDPNTENNPERKLIQSEEPTYNGRKRRRGGDEESERLQDAKLQEYHQRKNDEEKDKRVNEEEEQEQHDHHQEKHADASNNNEMNKYNLGVKNDGIEIQRDDGNVEVNQVNEANFGIQNDSTEKQINEDSLQVRNDLNEQNNGPIIDTTILVAPENGEESQSASRMDTRAERSADVADVEARRAAKLARRHKRKMRAVVHEYISVVVDAAGTQRSAYVHEYLEDARAHFVTFKDSLGGSGRVKLSDTNFRVLSPADVRLLHSRPSPAATSADNRPMKRRRSAPLAAAVAQGTPAGTELIGAVISIRWPGNGDQYVALVIGFQAAAGVTPGRSGLHKVYYVADESTEIIDLSTREWQRDGPGTDKWDRSGLVGKRIVVFWEGEYEDTVVKEPPSRIPFEAFVVRYLDGFRYRLLYTQDDNLEDRDLGTNTASWDVVEPGVSTFQDLPIVSWTSSAD